MTSIYEARRKLAEWLVDEFMETVLDSMSFEDTVEQHLDRNSEAWLKCHDVVANEGSTPAELEAAFARGIAIEEREKIIIAQLMVPRLALKLEEVMSELSPAHLV